MFLLVKENAQNVQPYHKHQQESKGDNEMCVNVVAIQILWSTRDICHPDSH